MRGVKYPRMYAARDEKFRAGGYVTEPGLHFLSHKREAFTHWLSLPERGNTHPVQTSSQPTPATIDFSGHLNVRSYKRNKNKIVNASASQVYAPFSLMHTACLLRGYRCRSTSHQPASPQSCHSAISTRFPTITHASRGDDAALQSRGYWHLDWTTKRR